MAKMPVENVKSVSNKIRSRKFFIIAPPKKNVSNKENKNIATRDSKFHTLFGNGGFYRWVSSLPGRRGGLGDAFARVRLENGNLWNDAALGHILQTKKRSQWGDRRILATENWVVLPTRFT